MATGEKSRSARSRTHLLADPLQMLLPMGDGRPLPEPPRVGEESLHVLTSLEEVRAANERVAATAQRLMSIYTPYLDPQVYDQTGFLEVVKRFVLGRNFAKVRVLIGEHARAGGSQNRFLAMARRLTSYIDIRSVATPHHGSRCAYLIADDRAIVYRVRADQWDGVAGFNQPPVVRRYMQEFDEIWTASAPDLEIRIAHR